MDATPSYRQHRRFENPVGRACSRPERNFRPRARRGGPRRPDRAVASAHVERRRLGSPERLRDLRRRRSRQRRPAGRRGQSGAGARLRQRPRHAGQDRSDDACVIAHFVPATAPEIRPLRDEETRLLGDLVAKRQRERITPARVRKSIARLLQAPQRELDSLDGDIDDSAKSSPVWREKEDLLASVPGIGPTIARTLVAEVPELGTLDRRTIAALVGISPWTRQSGQWRGKSFIVSGRAKTRRPDRENSKVARHP